MQVLRCCRCFSSYFLLAGWSILSVRRIERWMQRRKATDKDMDHASRDHLSQLPAGWKRLHVTAISVTLYIMPILSLSLFGRKT